jgi:hypothetical protein
LCRPDQAPANAANDGTDRSVPAAAMTVIMATLPAIYVLALYAMIADGCRAHRHVGIALCGCIIGDDDTSHRKDDRNHHALVIVTSFNSATRDIATNQTRC